MPKHHDLARSTATTFSFPDATEAAFVQFDDAIEDFVLHASKAIRDEVPKLAVKQGGRIRLDADQIGCRTSRDFKHGTFDQPQLLFFS